MRKFFKIILPVLVLAIGFTIFRGLQATRPEQPPPEIRERVWRVAVTAAEPRDLAPELTLYGRVQTPDLLRIAASAQARVAAVPVRDGERVAAGDLLVQLDERDLLPPLRRVEAEIAELEAEIESERNRRETDRLALVEEEKLLAIARNALARANRLESQRLASDAEVDAAEETLARQALAVSAREMTINDHPARLAALEARLQQATQERATLALDYERSRVEAPYDGIVTGVEVTVGDQVGRDDVLLRLYSLDSIEIRARIPAPYSPEVRQALANGPLEAHIERGGEQIALRLVRLAGQAHPSGVDGIFVIDGRTDALRLGQLVTIRLELVARSDVVVLPFAAVYDGQRIYELVDGRMLGVRVETLGSVRKADGTDGLLVRSPEIAAGDSIIVTHMPNAVEGLRVEAVD